PSSASSRNRSRLSTSRCVSLDRTGTCSSMSVISVMSEPPDEHTTGAPEGGEWEAQSCGVQPSARSGHNSFLGRLVPNELSNQPTLVHDEDSVGHAEDFR